jgi:hypothetical protein
MSQFIGMTGADGAGWVVWTPILNSAVSLTGILKGQTDMSMIGASVACTALLGTVFWIASLRLFSREQILNRS